MSNGRSRYTFEEEHSFLHRLEELVAEGVPPDQINTITPIPVPGVEPILGLKPSPLRFFTLAGALAGLVAGFAFTIWTVNQWPLITGGKPLISIPPFVVIAFALTILLGATASLTGFLLLARLPSLRGLREPQAHDNLFIIEVGEEGRS
jgi:hypothetical protein